MGNTKGDYEYIIELITKDSMQIRHNALEAARVVAHKFLSKKLGEQKFFMKILKYPHQVYREKPIATGAGADRYSQGMRLAFGKPAGKAVITKPGMKLVEVRVNKENVEIAKEALKKLFELFIFDLLGLKDEKENN